MSVVLDLIHSDYYLSPLHKYLKIVSNSSLLYKKWRKKVYTRKPPPQWCCVYSVLSKTQRVIWHTRTECLHKCECLCVFEWFGISIFQAFHFSCLNETLSKTGMSVAFGSWPDLCLISWKWILNSFRIIFFGKYIRRKELSLIRNVENDPNAQTKPIHRSLWIRNLISCQTLIHAHIYKDTRSFSEITISYSHLVYSYSILSICLCIDQWEQFGFSYHTNDNVFAEKIISLNLKKNVFSFVFLLTCEFLDQ